MGMNYTFRDADGNMIFSIEGVNAVTENEVSLESMANDICKKNNEIKNSLDKIDFLSNARAMESFGFISTESVGEKVKGIVSKIGKKIQDLFTKIADFFRGIFEKINNKINSMAAKRAAAAVLKKMENPSDKDAAVELAKVTAVIESDNMGMYVVLKKEYSKLNEIKKFINERTEYTNKEQFKATAESYKSMLTNFEEKAKQVSAGEKRREAIAFYKEMASVGTTKVGDAVKKELDDLEVSRKTITKQWKDLDPNKLAKGNDDATNIVIARYQTITSLYGVLTKYIAAINSLSTAAIGAKNEVLTGQDKD